MRLSSVELSDESKVDGVVTGGLALLLAAVSPYIMLAMHWNKTADDKLRKPFSKLGHMRTYFVSCPLNLKIPPLSPLSLPSSRPHRSTVLHIVVELH